MILSQLLLILGVLVGGVSVYIAVFAFVESLTANKNMSLMWADGELPKKSKSLVIRLCRPVVHRLILPMIAKRDLTEYKKNIKREIHSAGLGQELNEDEYVGLQIFLGLVLPLVVVSMNLLFSLEYPLYLIIAFGVFGFIFLALELNALKGKTGPMTTVKGVMTCGFCLTAVLYLTMEVLTK